MATALLVLNLNELIEVSKLLRYQRDKLLDVAAQRYLKYTIGRFVSLSGQGGGKQWRPLAESTIRTKESRGITDHPERILRESDTLLHSLGVKTKKDYKVVGIVKHNTTETYRGQHSGTIARYHHTGDGVPKRTIFVRPNPTLRKQMTEDVRKALRKMRKPR